MKADTLIPLFKITSVAYGLLAVISVIVKNPLGVVISGALFTPCYAPTRHLEHKKKIQEATA